MNRVASLSPTDTSVSLYPNLRSDAPNVPRLGSYHRCNLYFIPQCTHVSISHGFCSFSFNSLSIYSSYFVAVVYSPTRCPNGIVLPIHTIFVTIAIQQNTTFHKYCPLLLYKYNYYFRKLLFPTRFLRSRRVLRFRRHRGWTVSLSSIVSVYLFRSIFIEEFTSSSYRRSNKFDLQYLCKNNQKIQSFLSY